MRDRRRNFIIIALVLGLLAMSLLIIVPGSPLSKPTKRGLDLKGGVELVYEGRPTPQVPKVTPEAIDNAIETIRKRVDALGVSEPEIQRSGANQITIGLPDVTNQEEAAQRVGTTAQLHFYDWEKNVIGDPNAPIEGLFQAVKQASNAKPKAEPEDIPGKKNDKELRKAGVNPENAKAVQTFYDRKNDSKGDKYYLFGPSDKQIGDTATNCKELLAPYADKLEKNPALAKRGPKPKVPTGSACKPALEKLGAAGPPSGSQVLVVPRGIVVVKAEKPKDAGKDTPDRYFVLEDDSELSGSDIENPEQNTDQRTQEQIVTMEFTDKGRGAFQRVTKRLAQRGSEVVLPPGAERDAALQRFAITLDDEIVSLATIDFRENPEGIDGRTGAQINGIGSIEETQDLAEQLRIGALQIDLKRISSTKVSATLGQQALSQGLTAAAAGFALVLLFLILFYRGLGLIAGVTLGVYAVFLFAIVKLIPITLTLPGIAGLILTLGVAADANIVIFERIKEEVREGRSIPASISAGYQKALRTIIDANVVTIGVAFILFMLATAGVKGFALALGVGTIISLFTAVLATSAILGSLSRTRFLGSRAALGAGGGGRPWTFDFSGAAKWFFSMSGVILVVGALAIAGLGLNFGIDFESGTKIVTPLKRSASVEQVRDALPAEFQSAKIQAVDDPDLGENVVQIKAEIDSEDVPKVEQALDDRFGVVGAEFSSDTVGPTFGAQIAETAVIAVIASLVLISLYIGLRFSFKFAVPVLIALAHDLLITAGVYSLTGLEVTTSTVAALLTILGYSLYDTIIVFDRIRENIPRMPRATFSQIVNRSMSEVLTRSLVTSFSTLLPVAALLFFGGETLQEFAFALLVGVASGTYSSIFIAAPVLTLWKEREPVYRRRRALVMEENAGVVPAYSDTSLGDEERAAARSDRPRRARTRRDRRRTTQTSTGAVPKQAETTEPAAPTPTTPPAATGLAEPLAPAEPEAGEPEAAEPERIEPDAVEPEPDTQEPAAEAPPPAPAAESRPKPKPKKQTRRQRKRHGRR